MKLQKYEPNIYLEIVPSKLTIVIRQNVDLCFLFGELNRFWNVSQRYISVYAHLYLNFVGMISRVKSLVKMTDEVMKAIQ